MILRLLFLWIVFSFLFLACNKHAATKKEFQDLKKSLFDRTNEISKLPIYADPPSSDYEDVKKGIFFFQIDSIEIDKIQKYKNELEPFILQRIDSSYSWVYLAAYFQYKSAVPKIRDRLLKCDKFYGWEGPDYSNIESYLMDDNQYCYQMAFISAIEYITSQPIEKAITLTKQEYIILKTKSDKCTDTDIDSIETYCAACWLLEKLNGK